MQIDASKLPTALAAALKKDIAAGWAPSLSLYMPADDPSGQGQDGTVTGNGPDAAQRAAKNAQLLVDMYHAMSTTPSCRADPSGATTADLAVGQVDFMASCVDDPASAKSEIQSLTSPRLVACTLEELNAQLHEPMVSMDGKMWMPQSAARAFAAANVLQPQLQATAEQDQAANKSQAETISDLLQMQLSQGQAYWAAQDPYGHAGDQQSIARIQFEVLQQVMAQQGG